MARRRPEIAAEEGRTVGEVFVPQTHEPGAEAEVDFADLWIVLRGVKTKVFLFTLRLSYSGKAVHRAFATQGQEAFLEGHVHAFTQLGGVPTRHIRYDNLKAAVSRVLRGRGHDAFWAAARKAHGDAAGTRELIDVLVLHRHLTNSQVTDGLTAALSVGATTADVVAVEARRASAQPANQPASAAAPPGVWVPATDQTAGRVSSLTERRLTDPGAVIAGLPTDTRPLPTVDAYDQLLRLSTATDHHQPQPSPEREVSPPEEPL